MKRGGVYDRRQLPHPTSLSLRTSLDKGVGLVRVLDLEPVRVGVEIAENGGRYIHRNWYTGVAVYNDSHRAHSARLGECSVS